MPDEVARIGALSNGSNGQRSLESASLHFERHCGREGASRAGARTRNPEPKAKDLKGDLSPTETQADTLKSAGSRIGNRQHLLCVRYNRPYRHERGV